MSGEAIPPGAGARISLAVPDGGPLFAGHFPGRPILPGIGLLHLALGALAASGPSRALREVEILRLRRPVAPGEVLEVEGKSLDPEGRLRLEVRRGAERVADGTLRVDGPWPELARGAQAGRTLDAVGSHGLDDLLPHRPPMRFVRSLETATEDGVVCAVRIPDGSAFTGGGTAPALVAIEMAAQSAAVFEAHLRAREQTDRGARIGYLVGARDVRFAQGRVPAGRTLSATVRLSGAAPPLSSYAFEVSDGDDLVATGTVSTWLSK